jgi:hypothetical protein
VDDKLFADVAAALAALGTAAEKGDGDAIAKADQWLFQQGDIATRPLAGVLHDENAPLAQRIAVTRTLARLRGTRNVLIEALATDQSIVRVNIVQALGSIEPTDKEIVAVCMKLAQDGSDASVQRQAIVALGRIGPAAKAEAVPALQAILNDASASETLRGAARDALKQIDERRGLMGLTE